MSVSYYNLTIEPEITYLGTLNYNYGHVSVVRVFRIGEVFS
jgi:hypothetical protein